MEEGHQRQAFTVVQSVSRGGRHSIAYSPRIELPLLNTAFITITLEAISRHGNPLSAPIETPIALARHRNYSRNDRSLYRLALLLVLFSHDLN